MWNTPGKGLLFMPYCAQVLGKGHQRIYSHSDVSLAVFLIFLICLNYGERREMLDSKHSSYIIHKNAERKEQDRDFELASAPRFYGDDSIFEPHKQDSEISPTSLIKIGWPRTVAASSPDTKIGWPVVSPPDHVVFIQREYPWPQATPCPRACVSSKSCSDKCISGLKSPRRPFDDTIQWPQERRVDTDVRSVRWSLQPPTAWGFPFVSKDVDGNGSLPTPGSDDVILTFAVGGLAISALTPSKLNAFRQSITACTSNKASLCNCDLLRCLT